MTVLVGCAVAFVVALIVATHLARRPLAALMDVPNERSLHAAPVPRSGGLAITAGIVAGLVVLLPAGLELEGAGWMGAGAAAVVAVSFVDDLSHVNKAVRLAIHLGAAALAIASGIALERIVLPGLALPLAPAVGWAVALVVVVWMVNVYNFMDGMDGFAGGMAVAGFGTLAALGARAGDAGFTAATAVVAAAGAGFLVRNFPPARIFMGDLGSSLLGFLAGVAILAGAARGVFPLWVGLLVFSPFLVDATVTLCLRIVRREPFWESHKSHYYQRLVELGLGHRRTVLGEYALMGAVSASGFVVVSSGARWQAVVLVTWVLAYTVGALLVERTVAQRRTDGPSEAA